MYYGYEGGDITTFGDEFIHASNVDVVQLFTIVCQTHLQKFCERKLSLDVHI
jgi:hypothetical protein